MEMIYHIVDHNEWEQAQAAGVYCPPSVAAEGFIHASYRAQVLLPANTFYRGQADLVLVEIDPPRVQTPLRLDWVGVRRDGVETEEVYPPIYGPLNRDAVLRVLPFPLDPDGRFRLPVALQETPDSATRPHGAEDARS